MQRYTCFRLLTLAALAVPATLFAQTKLLTTPQPIPGQWIVVMQDASSPGAVETLANATASNYSGRLLGPPTSPFVYETAIKGFAIAMPQSAALLVSQNPAVQYVIPDSVATPGATESPAPSWGLDRIDQRTGMDNAYHYNSSGAGVNVYVIDTGILISHVEFAGRTVRIVDFIGDGQVSGDCGGHGTHVAGIVGGIRYGVAKNVNLIGVRIQGCGSSGTLSALLAGVDWVAKNAVKPAVANISFGMPANPALNTAVAKTVLAGIAVVVAAGNENQDAGGFSPASATGAITVGSIDRNDTRASTSNFGPSLTLFAPGVSIVSAYIGSNVATATLSGTSMAAPHVTGVVARYLEIHPGAPPAQVKAFLKSQATRLRVLNPGAGSPNLLLYADPGVDTLYSVGLNKQWELGTGTATSAVTPVLASSVPPLSDVSGGLYSGMGLAWDETVWGWGDWQGSLVGISPGRMFGLAGMVGIEGRYRGGFALGADGSVWGWGANARGELGDGTTTARSSPVPIPGLGNVVSLSSVNTNEDHTLAVTADGKVWAWGANYVGQLGNGTETNSASPVEVPGLTGFDSVSAGPGFSLALRSDGTVWAWGMNSRYQLGAATGTFTDSAGVQLSGSPLPVQVGGNGFGIVKVAAGYSHALALEANGDVWMWGYDGVNPPNPLPTLIPGLNHVVDISASNYASIAVKSDGTVWAWGANKDGGLGLGALGNVAAPTQVTGIPPARVARTFYLHSHILAESLGTILPVPASLNFGSSTVGAPPVSQGVSVTNSGTFPVTVEAVQTTGVGFTAGSGCTGVTLTPGASCQTQVSFVPQAAGPMAATLEIVDSSLASPEAIPLTGTGVLTPPAVKSLTLLPASVVGGTPSTATVTLTQAVTTPVNVSLKSDSAEAVVPVSVTVPAGYSFATFSIATTPLSGNPVAATITATAAASSARAVLTITPPSGPLWGFTITINKVEVSSVTGGLIAPYAPIGTVKLSSGAQIIPVVVRVTSSSPVVTVPATVTIAAGSQEATFPITTAATATTVNVALSVTDGKTLSTKTLTVVPAFTIAPTAVVGGAAALGTVNIDGVAPAEGAVVTLAGNLPSVTIPATFTILPGKNSLALNIGTSPVNAVSVATITATYPSGRKVTATLTINPPPLSGLTIAPAAMVGGFTATGTVTLASKAPAGGVVVTLASNANAAVVPATVTVPAGATSATFTITTSQVGVPTAVIGTATLAGLIAQAPLTLNPVRVSSVTFSSATAPWTQPPKGTITLASAAPPGGVTVILTSYSPVATVPATVAIPAGTSSVVFGVTTTYVAVPTLIVTTATLNGASVPGQFTSIPQGVSNR